MCYKLFWKKIKETLNPKWEGNLTITSGVRWWFGLRSRFSNSHWLHFVNTSSVGLLGTRSADVPEDLSDRNTRPSDSCLTSSRDPRARECWGTASFSLIRGCPNSNGQRFLEARGYGQRARDLLSSRSGCVSPQGSHQQPVVCGWALWTCHRGAALRRCPSRPAGGQNTLAAT